jgi:hypothetical protein
VHLCCCLIVMLCILLNKSMFYIVSSYNQVFQWRSLVIGFLVCDKLWVKLLSYFFLLINIVCLFVYYRNLFTLKKNCFSIKYWIWLFYFIFRGSVYNVKLMQYFDLVFKLAKTMLEHYSGWVRENMKYSFKLIYSLLVYLIPRNFKYSW